MVVIVASLRRGLIGSQLPSPVLLGLVEYADKPVCSCAGHGWVLSGTVTARLGFIAGTVTG